MLSIINTKTFTLTSHCTQIDPIEKSFDSQKTLQLSSVIIVKKHMLLEIYGGNAQLNMVFSMVQKEISRNIPKEQLTLFVLNFQIG